MKRTVFVVFRVGNVLYQVNFVVGGGWRLWRQKPLLAVKGTTAVRASV